MSTTLAYVVLSLVSHRGRIPRCHNLVLKMGFPMQAQNISDQTRSTLVAAEIPCTLYNPDEETRLISACQRGERESQRQLYELHCDKVYRLMCRMVGSNNADDLTQQVFLRVLQKMDRFHGRSSFSTWLYRLATNEALQFLRRNGRHRTQPLSYEPLDSDENSHEKLDLVELIEVGLAKLDPDLRVTLLLREIEELSYLDIANSLDIAEGTVASRLNRARSQLRWLVEGAF